MARILYLHHTSVLGGAERSLLELVTALPRAAFEPLVVLPGEGALAQRLRAAQIRAEFVFMERFRRTWDPLKILGYLQSLSRAGRELAALAAREEVALIHANSNLATLYAGEATKRIKRPLLWHSRDLVSIYPLARRLSRQASFVIATSNAVREHLLAEGVEAKKLRLVYNGLDLSSFEPERLKVSRRQIRKEFGVPEGAPLLGTVGQMAPWKNYEDFLRLVSRLLEKHPQLRALLVGADLLGDNPNYEGKLKELAGALGVLPFVNFAGWREDIPEIMGALTLYVSTAKREPFGRTLVEAMAAGRPVVSYRSGGREEIIAGGETGFAVPDGEIAALAERVESLLGDTALCERMGEAARRRAAEQFSAARAAQAIESCYRELLSPERT